MQRAYPIFVWTLAGLALSLSLAGFIASSLPYARLQPWGELIRTAADVTEERYQRYVEVSRLLAAALLLGGCLLLAFRRPVVVRLEAFFSECRNARCSLRSRWVTRADWLLVLGVTIAGALLRWTYLHLPMAYDEAYTFLNYARRPLIEALSDYSSPNNHLLNTLAMHVTYRVWGQQEWALRLPVLVAGAALVPLVYAWAKRVLDGPQAVLAAALCACSAPLIVYSVNARGYIFVTLAAVAMDHALRRVHQQSLYSSLHWLVAWIALVLGLWAIPVMIYPAAGIAAWYLLMPLVQRSESPARELGRRAVRLAIYSGSAAVAVLALYAPGYIFRGLIMAREPLMAPLPAAAFLERLPETWFSALRWWVDGPVPLPLALLLVTIGGITLCRRWPQLVQLTMPFAVLLLVQSVQRVAPPTRVFVYLTPWILLLMAQGLAAPLLRFGCRPLAVKLVAVALIAGTYVYLPRPSPLQDERPLIYHSIPAVTARLAEQVRLAEGRRSRLLVPLPADIPARYYMTRQGFSIPINGQPQPDERVWLITERGRRPEETLGNMVIQLQKQHEQFAPWRKIDEQPHATLWMATGTDD